MQLDIPDLSFDFHCLSLHLTDLRKILNLNPKKSQKIFLRKSNFSHFLSVDFKKYLHYKFKSIYSYARLGKINLVIDS